MRAVKLMVTFQRPRRRWTSLLTSILGNIAEKLMRRLDGKIPCHFQSSFTRMHVPDRAQPGSLVTTGFAVLPIQ